MQNSMELMIEVRNDKMHSTNALKDEAGFLGPCHPKRLQTACDEIENIVRKTSSFLKKCYFLDPSLWDTTLAETNHKIHNKTKAP